MRLKGLVFAIALLTGSAAKSHAAIRTTPGIERVGIVEVTGSPIQMTFGPTTPFILSRLTGNLNSGNRDFTGLSSEYYDVFYSDAAGVPDPDGDFISIECTYTNTSGGGGNNIASVFLRFVGGLELCACSVASAVYLGSNAIPGSAAFAANCNTADFSTMGSGAADQRTRITLDFSCITPVRASTWGAIKQHYR